MDQPLAMFEDRPYKRTFYNAPQSVTSFMAAFLEPAITVLTFLAANLYIDAFVGRPELVLCLLVFALTFPGRNRFRQNPLAAAVDIASSWTVLIGVLLLCGYVTRSLGYFEERALIAWVVATPVVQWAAVWVGRRLLLHQLSQPEARRRAIIIGAGPQGVKVMRALTTSDDKGVDFLGYFDDRADARVDGLAMEEVKGGLKDAADFIRRHGVHEVFITLPLGSQPRIVELLEQMQDTTASLFFVPDIFGISIIQGRLQDMNGLPVVGICETPFTGTNELVKRVSDVVLASIILVLISPILLAIAIGVKLSSPGPIIFKQRRTGLDGEDITVYKFRSMTTQDNGPVVKQATKGDARITRFGAFLRRTSLDELPQLINVLRGEMSLVGPRPLPADDGDFLGDVRRRLLVRPGMTGLWQVSGRSELSWDDAVRLDLYYVDNWSLAFDLVILWRTVGVVLRRHGAF